MFKLTLNAYFILLWYGIKDSLRIDKIIIHLYCSKKLQKKIFNCIFYNSIFVVLFHLLYHKIILTHLPNQYTFLFLNIIYLIIWEYPIYIISLFLNNIWHHKISKIVFILNNLNDKDNFIWNYKNILSNITDEIYYKILYILFLIQIYLSSFIPIIGYFISFCLISWLYSYYCFEFVWRIKKMNLLQRIHYFQNHWIYFLGYGMFLSINSFLWNIFISNGLFSLFIPFYIILATISTPRRIKNNNKIFIIENLPIFYIPIKLNNFILKILFYKNKE
jgi:etoposide-induced 2.4 mRNA